MNCEEAMKNLREYLSGHLPAEQALLVRTHLKSCRSCPDVVTVCGFVVLREKALRPRMTRLKQKAS
jgi:hypothetical protein